MNTEKRSDTASVPSVAAGGVSVGSIFQRNIVYETVRPQITGYGLRESAFSWSLEDEAIAMGSYVFVAAVGVPKDAGKLFLKQSVAVKASSFLLEGDWASTGQRTEEITLQ
jgi:hypothetical protein